VRFGDEWLGVYGEYNPPWPRGEYEPGYDAHVIIYRIEDDSGRDVLHCMDAEAVETIAAELAREMYESACYRD
jgi:hypothetical protein